MIWPLLLSIMISGQASSPAPPAAPAGCTRPEHRQFDFWVGNWRVHKRGDEKIVAHSLIEKLYAGCAIRENWMPLSGQPGGSLTAWDPDDRKWRQTWVDSGNSLVQFEGGVADGAMRLSGLWRNAGGAGVHQHYRISWFALSGGQVRQLGEITADNGKTWQPGFDFIYEPDTPK